MAAAAGVLDNTTLELALEGERLCKSSRGNLRMEEPIKSIDDIPNHILDKIFEYLPTKQDLLNTVRLVSRNWNTIGASICRRRLVNLSSQALSQLDNVFMTTFAKPLSIPWSSIRFLHNDLPSPTRYEEWMFEDFGTHLWNLDSNSQLWDDLLHFLQFTPNLRALVLVAKSGELFPRIIPTTLNLRFLKYLDITITSHSTSFLSVLIRKYDVRLKKLNLRVLLDDVNVETAKKLMSIIKHHSYFIPTIYLAIVFHQDGPHVEEDEIISIIAAGNLKLTKLRVVFREPRPNETFITGFGKMLASSRQSLRSLDITCNLETGRCTDVLKFPILSALKILEIEFFGSCIGSEFKRSLFSDAETKKFPVLEKVSMRSLADAASVFRTESCRWDTVTEVEYEFLRESFSVADLPQLYPNLKKLILHVHNNETEAIVYIMGNMQKLEHLELHCTDIPDLNSILSGIPNVHEVYEENPELQLRIARQRARAGRPSLLSFSRLKTLKLEFTFCDDRLALLDSGAYLSILPLEPLELLELTDVDISEECAERLRKRHQVVNIETRERFKAA